MLQWWWLWWGCLLSFIMPTIWLIQWFRFREGERRKQLLKERIQIQYFYHSDSILLYLVPLFLM
jgi:hypothetical protein